MSVVLFLSSQSPAAVPPIVRLIFAQAWAESTSTPECIKNDAIGDTHYRDGTPRPESEWAYGFLQVRQICADDVNRVYGTSFQAKDCLGDPILSVRIYMRYIRMLATKERLGHEPTFEDMARVWNGGPHGWRRPKTLAYWKKVQKRLEELLSDLK